MHVVGLVLHPERDCSGAVGSVLDWAARREIRVLGFDSEVRRLNCTAEPVTAQEMQQRADLVVSLGGDGTMLRAMRLADGQRFPVLGVNLGKLGFLAEVDVPDLPGALSAIDSHQFTTEPRLAVDAMIDGQMITAFNDIAFVRFPGQHTAEVAVRAGGRHFVSYAADAIVVATPTGSTAYSFSAGGPIVSPAVQALVVTPVAPHSAYNRGLVVSPGDQLALEILPASGPLAVEADGGVAANVAPGDMVQLMPRPGAASVVRLGRTTFYERARRKLRLADSAEIPLTWGPRLAGQPGQRPPRRPPVHQPAPVAACGGSRAGPAHPGGRGLRVIAVLLGDPGRAAHIAERADRRGDRLLHLPGGWFIGALQRRYEQGVGPGGAAEFCRREPHRRPPCLAATLTPSRGCDISRMSPSRSTSQRT
jgi:NAD+ kinase